MSTEATGAATEYVFDHINLAEIDDSRAKIEENVYTYEINALKYYVGLVKSVESKNFNKPYRALKGSFTIVDDPKYSGRKVWQDFYPDRNKANLVFLKKLSQATGVLQGESEELEDWASQFATLNPPARFQAPMSLKAPWNNPAAEAADYVNEIVMFQAKPAE